MEKRRLDDLSLVAIYTLNPSDKWDETNDIEINPATGHLWVIDHTNHEWHIEILNRDFSSAGWVMYSIKVTSLQQTLTGVSVLLSAVVVAVVVAAMLALTRRRSL